jgi:hypothetical protein
VAARRGMDERDLTISLPEAAAITSVIETKDPVIAAPSAAELTQPLADALGEPGGRVYLFPFIARQEVIAILLASGNVNAAALEFLCGAAGLRIEAFPTAAPAAAAPASAETAPTAVATPAPARSAWDSLSEEDQRLHLQAQRIARVKVAELRLYHADELRKGVAERNIYGALREQIEPIRTSFLQTFLAKSDTMVDYLHLELVRSLAHDDDRLLGDSYPGPMV